MRDSPGALRASFIPSDPPLEWHIAGPAAPAIAGKGEVMKRGLFALPIPGVVLLAYNVVVLLSSDPVGANRVKIFVTSVRK
jgi:hypothetical protein